MKKTNYIAKKPDNQGLIHYTDAEHATWKKLYERQIKIIDGRACDAYLAGIERLSLSADHIPQCMEVSKRLGELTAWSVVPVEALISFKEFFDLLASKQFPAASFIRIPEELDYLQEPDIFHELFGHCPMLTDPDFANFTHRVGELGQKANKIERAMLARLYWFTVEFGLIRVNDQIKIYGGGILSSKQESVYALESAVPLRIDFDLLTVLRTPYRYDALQKVYFVVDDVAVLYDLVNKDLFDVFAEAKRLGAFSSPEELTDLRSC